MDESKDDFDTIRVLEWYSSDGSCYHKQSNQARLGSMAAPMAYLDGTTTNAKPTSLSGNQPPPAVNSGHRIADINPSLKVFVSRRAS